MGPNGVLTPTQLAFTVQPMTTDGNEPITPAVEVAIQDEFGNTVTTQSDPVMVAIGNNAGTGTLSGATMVDAVDGIATFSDLSIDLPGSGYTLEATSGTFTESASSAFDIVLTFTSIEVGHGHSCGVTLYEHAYCWGNNAVSQLGDGNQTAIQATPVLVSGGHSFVSVSAGGQHTCGLTGSEDAYCWGGNNDGQLGDGTTNFRTIPALVSGGHSFAHVSAAEDHTCAVTSGRSAYCWGRNQFGQLGDGTMDERLTPVPVSGGSGAFASIDPGDFHTCALTPNGDAYCWGRNQFGQLGDGTMDDRLTIVLVSGSLSFASVSAGGLHTCALTADGEAYCWGSNVAGELGDGTMDDRLTPVLVSGGLSFASVSLGLLHTCAVTLGGDAYCWGNGGAGQLGDGTATDRLTPALVSGGLNFSSISSATNHTCGVTTGGDAYCWGFNMTGQLGDGTTDSSPVPVRVVQ